MEFHCPRFSVTWANRRPSKGDPVLLGSPTTAPLKGVPFLWNRILLYPCRNLILAAMIKKKKKGALDRRFRV